jgi:hypothetical protein
MSLVIKDQCTVLKHSAFLAFLDTLADPTHGMEVSYSTESVTGKTRVHYTLLCDTLTLANQVTDKIKEAVIIYGG